MLSRTKNPIMYAAWSTEAVLLATYYCAKVSHCIQNLQKSYGKGHLEWGSNLYMPILGYCKEDIQGSLPTAAKKIASRIDAIASPLSTRHCSCCGTSVASRTDSSVIIGIPALCITIKKLKPDTPPSQWTSRPSDIKLSKLMGKFM